MSDKKDLKISQFGATEQKSLSPINSLALVQSSHIVPASISKKAERLSAAIYLITEHFSYSEPLKQALRMKAIDILILAGGQHFNSSDIRNIAVSQSLRSANETLSLLSLSVTIGLISTLNFSILSEQYSGFISDLSGLKESVAQSVLLTDFFNSGQENITTNLNQLKTQNIESDRYISGESKNKPVTKNHPNDFIGQKRRELIVEILKEAGQSVSIKLIVEKVKDAGEKTVQRDLNFLIEQGKVEKLGNRRWSLYKLKAQV